MAGGKKHDPSILMEIRAHWAYRGFQVDCVSWLSFQRVSVFEPLPCLFPLSPALLTARTGFGSNTPEESPGHA